jgi:hypothetical protein
MITKPVIEKMIIRTKTLIEYCFNNRNIPIARGTNQFGKTIRMFRLKIFRNETEFLGENNFDETIP